MTDAVVVRESLAQPRLDLAIDLPSLFEFSLPIPHSPLPILLSTLALLYALALLDLSHGHLELLQNTLGRLNSSSESALIRAKLLQLAREELWLDILGSAIQQEEG
jgi:hypothetical protein